MKHQRRIHILKQLKTAVGVYLKKEDRRRRAWIDFQKATIENRPEIRKAAAEYLLLIRREAAVKLGEAKTISEVNLLEKEMDWTSIQEEGIKIFSMPLLKVVNAGQDLTRRKIKKDNRVDPIGVAAVKWSTQHSGELIVEITDDTRAAINLLVKEAVKTGQTVKQVAAQVRPLIGLTQQQTRWVINYTRRLVDEDVLSLNEISKLSEKYSKKLLRYRAETIARTETAFALNEGQVQGYAAMGAKYLERVEDPECCEICFNNNHRSYTIKGASGVLPAHPNCEGTWVYTDVPPGKETEWPPKGEWKKPTPKPKPKKPAKPRKPAAPKKPPKTPEVGWPDWKFKDLGIDIVDLRLMDKKGLENLYNQMKYLLKKYPQSQLKSLRVMAYRGNSYAYVSGGKHMVLNSKYFKNLSKLNDSILNDMKLGTGGTAGFHGPATALAEQDKWISVITHEYAHTLLGEWFKSPGMSWTEYDQLMLTVKNLKTSSSNKVTRALNKYKNFEVNTTNLEEWDTVRDEFIKIKNNNFISGYSKKNNNEFFAETFTAIEHEKKLNQTMKTMKKEVVDKLPKGPKQ